MITDAAARDTALDPTRSFIVQAPAGSGKTGLLVYRILRLLTTVELPQQILAITFTRKATAEMRERVFSLMRMAEAGERSADSFEQYGIDLASKALERDQRLGWNLLDSPHQLQILTIDSFCAKLTSSMPWLSRLGDRPRTTDRAEVHYAAAVEQLLSELLNDQSAISPALRTVMLELDFNYNKARQLFLAMLSKRDQWLRYLLHNNLPELRTTLEGAWSGIVESELQFLRERIPESMLEQLLTLATGASQVLAGRPDQKPTPLAAFLDFDSTQTRNLSLAHWKGLVFMLVAPSSSQFRKTVNVATGFVAKSAEKDVLLALLSELVEDHELLNTLNQVSGLPPVCYSDQDWQQLLALEEVLKSLAAHLQLRFRAVGECDHSEVTQRANLALQELQNPTDLALRMDYALHHILVDEFQDTSTGQIDLLRKLTAGWSEASGAGVSDNGAKTLFLVGDPMQSIYRFREADVSLFLQVADNANTQVFDNLQIESLKLSENFRSSSSLVDWFNSTFNSSFPDANNVLTGAIRYAPATFSREPNHGEVQYLLAQDKPHEALLLAQATQQAVADLPSEGDRVAILVRSRPQLDYLLPALRALEIEYVGVDIQPLRSQQAVIDVIALCKALCREDDRLSWLALLRGPWCALSLIEIKQLVGETDATIWQQLSDLAKNELKLDELAPDTQARLQRFMAVMKPAMRQRQQVELGALARWSWRGLGGQQTLFGASINDIETVFDLIAGLQRAGDLSSMTDLDAALDGLFAKPSQAATRDAKVIVSTMHKAKGLQYHTVILPGLANQARAEDKSIMMWAEQQNSAGDTDLLLAPLSMESQGDDHYSYLRKLDTQRTRNELIRLMYVATTRAERKLVLIARAKIDSRSDELKPPISSSLLFPVWEALETKFELDTSVPVNDQPEQTLSNTLKRLPVSFSPQFKPEIQWQVAHQLAAPGLSDDSAEQLSDEQNGEAKVEFEWATELATGVGIVLHDWLQHIGPRVLEIKLDQDLQQRWRAELLALRVPPEKLGAAVKRLSQAVNNIQADQPAHFIFQRYAIEKNEYALSRYVDGAVEHFRIDRSFVDDHGVRWVVDYKSTFTKNADLDEFVDEQISSRHRAQLQKYGDLIAQIDSRPIKLAVYFPLLKQLRAWDYQSD